MTGQQSKDHWLDRWDFLVLILVQTAEQISENQKRSQKTHR